MTALHHPASEQVPPPIETVWHSGEFALRPDANPFCTRRVRPGAIRFRFDAEESTEHHDQACESICGRLIAARIGLIVGPHGSGKSTLLQTLMPRLQHRFPRIERMQTHAFAAAAKAGTVRSLAQWSSIRMHRRQNSQLAIERCQDLPRCGLLVVDGIEQLGVFGRQRLLRACRDRQQTVLATCHRAVGRLPVLYRTGVSAALISRLTESQLKHARPEIADAVRKELGRQDLTKLDNLRELWFDLYDVAETRRTRSRRCSDVATTTVRTTFATAPSFE